ncbi:hypothetical protein [Sedimentimonas flavescens]|uniref:hypothetical protein n=1 Tax=Sedimentimonas flavescens TaxID=2851012 RepID=UPI0021A85A28|nr:hypothetical protein [Sedimentimonas flavescens]MCT2541188.1 hypothetical protein [Sedimentimonas flavescens]WBL32152.1 hypothetical protein O5O51_10375 [Sinirhodobacter sp. HNIBRBA609]
MLSRLVTILAVLAITVVTSVVPTHAARMAISTGPDYVASVGQALDAPEGAELACQGRAHCAPADSEICTFVCANASVFLAPAETNTLRAHDPVGHLFPAEADHADIAPALAERPPKSLPL